MSMMEVIEGVSRVDDDKMEKMELIKTTCEEAGVEVPQEVTDYLDDPENGVVGKLRPGIEHGVTIEQSEGMEIIEIDLEEIDEDMDIIRITRTW